VGRAFLPEARAVLAAADRARSVAGGTTEGLRGTLRVGTLQSLTALDLPRLIGSFRARHPLVDVHVRVPADGSGGIVEDIRRDRLDVGIVVLAPGDAVGVTLRGFASVPLVALLPAEHRLAGLTRIALADLAGEDFVDGPAGYGTRMIVDRAFAQAGISRRILAEICDLRTAAAYVRELFAVAVVPGHALPRDSGVVLRPVDGLPANLTLHFALPPGEPAPVTAGFLELSDAFRSRGGVLKGRLIYALCVFHS
jgi:DNA-binding transcriptional LysR family regulator